MNRFLHGHATHPDWRFALALAAAQIEAQRGAPGAAAAPTLGWAYFTEPYAAHGAALLAALRQRWPGVAWVGASAVGIAAGDVEYMEEPALALMLTDLAVEHFRVFSGARPLGRFAAHAAQVHADPATADLGELIADMSARTASGYLFGGLASGGSGTVPPVHPVQLADGVLTGGLCGVAFDASVALVSRVTQGCQPVGPLRRVSAADGHVITRLDDEPALDCLLRDTGLAGIDLREALPRLREVLVGLNDAPGRATVSTGAATARRGAFGADTRVRHLIGLDPARRGIAIADRAAPGMQLAFCTRNVDAARRDLMRICAEVREEVEPESLPLPAAQALKAAGTADPADATRAPDAATLGPIAGAVYVSCAGRGGAHFGAPSAELAIVRHALGDVPLVGFFAAGEIAHHHLYGYTGVLTVFRRDAA